MPNTKRWTKKEFIDAVNPCGYKFRIWWFFLWHRHVTLLDIVNYKGVHPPLRGYVIRYLDPKFRDRHNYATYKEDFQSMREELTGAR